jgi:hypothetical protein
MDAHAKVTVKRDGNARSKNASQNSRKTAVIAQSLPSQPSKANRAARRRRSPPVEAASA